MVGEIHPKGSTKKIFSGVRYIYKVSVWSTSHIWTSGDIGKNIPNLYFSGMLMWQHLMHDFDASIIVSNWKEFCNIYIWPENVASTFLLSVVIKKVMSNLFPFLDTNMIWEEPPWKVFPDHPTFLSETWWTIYQQPIFLKNRHIIIWNNRQLCDNSRNIIGGLYQRVKLSVVNTSNIGFQNSRRNFDDMVILFLRTLLS